MNRSTTPLLALLLGLGVVWAGCDAEPGFLTPNLPPNTRISAGPPEAKDTRYQVELFWFGWDNDGFIDHYEVAWETPENWIGPIFSNDSLFTVEASESCCVSALPEDGEVTLRDSVFAQYHTFYVRAVDNQGVPDESPSFRTFNAKTLAPFTNITAGPNQLRIWGTDVTFKWNGLDDDGFVTSYEYALTSYFDYTRDTGDSTVDPELELPHWLDTLTYYPRPQGGYDTDSLVWRGTEAESVRFRNVTVTTDIPPVGNPLNDNKIIFAVRAIDNAGAKEQVLVRRGLADTDPNRPHGNLVVFDVKGAVNGPCISVFSNLIGSWDCFSAQDSRGVFARQGLRFRWTAVPRTSGANLPVAGFSYAVDDTAGEWTAFSGNSRLYPPETVPGTPEYWFPDAGRHTLFVRAVDTGGFISVLPINLQVFAGPSFCPEPERYILVVLDTNIPSLVGVFPATYDQVELGLMSYFFNNYLDQLQVHRTRGLFEPEVALMDCASSMFWFVSTDTFQGDRAVLWDYHAQVSAQSPPNVLPSYVSSGGNLFICGIQPINALRYTETNNGGIELISDFPLDFEFTLSDTGLVDHWATTILGISEVEETVGSIEARVDPSLYVRRMTSQVTGPNPYPDLDFDPLSWPQGPISPGFAHYDAGIIPRLLPDSTFAAEVVYTTDDDPNRVAGIRRLTEPGPNGNVVFLAFHPYFLQKAQFRDLLQAVLADFGEVANP